MPTKYRNSEPATVATGDVAIYPKLVGGVFLICVKDDTGAESCALGSGSLPDPTPAFEVFDSTANLALTGTFQTVPMTTAVAPETGYSISGGGVQVANAGSYKIWHKVRGDSTDGDRATGVSALFVNGVEVPNERTRADAYFRSTANGEGSSNSYNIVTLAAGDIVTVGAFIFGDNVETRVGSNLVLEVNE